MRLYCDIHRRRDDSGYRVTYTTDGENFRHVDSPVDIPAGQGDHVFVDVIPIIHTDGFIELLRRGAEVYYLRRLTMIKAVRERLGIKSKSAKTDIKALMAIDDKWFRRVDEDFLIMRRMITAFRSLLKTHQRLLNMSKAVSETERALLRKQLRFNDGVMRELAQIITEEAGKRYPAYNRLVEELGLSGDNHMMAREALAEILTYISPEKGFNKTARYFGLFKAERKGRRIYSGAAVKALQRLTMMIHNTIPRAKLQREVLKRIWTTIRQETQERLAGIPAQQQG